MSTETWAPKSLGEIEVMYCTTSNTQEVIDWMTPLLPLEATFDTFFGTVRVILDNDVWMNVGGEQYLYLDEDGFHTANKELFKMLFKKLETPA
jgi:hypothetical protein